MPMSSNLKPEQIAALAMMTKYVVWHDSNAADREVIAAANARISARASEVEKIKAGLSLFGYEFTSEGFAKLRAEVGDEAYYQAQREGGRLDAGPKEQAPSKSDSRAGAELNALTSSVSVRQVVLTYLKYKAEEGAKAREIQDFIESLRGVPLHEKTIGMTLFRLSKDGNVRREGRTWFFVPEAKNPAVSPAGSINRDTKEGEEP
jgi:hypothetical protein